MPEFPKFNLFLFLTWKEPIPFPNILYIFPDFLILIPKFLRQFIVECTSSDSKIFSAMETPWQIEPIKKDLIEIDVLVAGKKKKEIEIDTIGTIEEKILQEVKKMKKTMNIKNKIKKIKNNIMMKKIVVKVKKLIKVNQENNHPLLNLKDHRVCKNLIVLM